MQLNDTTINALVTVWPVLLSAAAMMIGAVTFAVRYQANKLTTDKRITNVEARVLSLENQYHDISKSLTRIETIVTMERRDDNGIH